MILKGRCISPGIARGPGKLVDVDLSITSSLDIPARHPPAREVERLQAALSRAIAQLDRIRRQVSRVSSQDAEIFSAHAVLLEDASLLDRLTARIHAQGLSAEAAVARLAKELHADFSASDHPVFRDRAADIVDIGRRLIDCLSETATRTPTPGAIIVAGDLTPSEFVRFAHQGAVGFVTETCGNKSHTAILARGLGVPLLTGLKNARERIADRAEIILDAAAGLVIVDPNDAERVRADSILARQAVLPRIPEGQIGAVSRDGIHVTTLLNISDPVEAAAIGTLGAEGVGLFRTEFLYIDRDSWPSEDDCLADYRRVSEHLGPQRELNLRLADFGAEKCPPYADIPINRNPSLGIRGIRLLLQRDDILRPQVRAIARLAAERPVTLLMPMIDTLDTLEATIDRLSMLCNVRHSSQLPFKLGTMIEVPAAGLMIEEILDRVDSVAIGLNDLTQYLLAADRDDELVERYHDALQPAVLRLVKKILDAAALRNRPVTMCGELAGDSTLAAVLLALGARRFSVSRSHYETTVAMVGRLGIRELTAAADELMTLRSGAAIRRLITQRFPESGPPLPL